MFTALSLYFLNVVALFVKLAHDVSHINITITMSTQHMLLFKLLFSCRIALPLSLQKKDLDINIVLFLVVTV